MRTLEMSNRTARLTNLNTRVEKHGEEDIVRADINFALTISPEDLVKLAHTEDTPKASERWRSLLIHTVEDLGGPLTKFLEHSISHIKFNRDFENHTLTVDSIGRRLTFTGAKLCKFGVELDYDDHTLRMTMQAQVDPEGMLDEIAEAINHTVTIDVEPGDDEDLLSKVKKADKEESKTEEVEKTNGKGKTKRKSGRAFPDAVDGTSTSPLN